MWASAGLKPSSPVLDALSEAPAGVDESRRASGDPCTAGAADSSEGCAIGFCQLVSPFGSATWLCPSFPPYDSAIWFCQLVLRFATWLVAPCPGTYRLAAGEEEGGGLIGLVSAASILEGDARWILSTTCGLPWVSGAVSTKSAELLKSWVGVAAAAAPVVVAVRAGLARLACFGEGHMLVLPETSVWAWELPAPVELPATHGCWVRTSAYPPNSNK